MNKISQREARTLKRRVAQLEEVLRKERNAYAELPGGVHLGLVKMDEDNAVACAVYTAARLGHAVVARQDGTRRFDLYALPHPKVPV